MPQRVPCPGCGRRVRIADELVGQPVQCPVCKVIFKGDPQEEEEPSRAAPRAATPPPPEPDEEEEAPAGDEEYDDADDRVGTSKSAERRRSRRRRPLNVDSWKAVRDGLARIAASFFVIIGTWTIVVLIYAVGFAVGLSVFDPTATLAIWVSAFVCLMLGVIATFILIIVGLTECREAPEKNGCYKLATISYNLICGSLLAGAVVVIFVIISFTFVYAGIWPLLPLTGGLTALASSVMGLLMTGSLFCFVFFLRAVSQTVRSPGLATNCLVLMILVPVMMPLGPTGIGGVFYLPRVLATDPQFLGTWSFLPLCCGVGGNLLPFGVSVWLVVTVFMVRAAVITYLEGNA